MKGKLSDSLLPSCSCSDFYIRIWTTTTNALWRPLIGQTRARTGSECSGLRTTNDSAALFLAGFFVRRGRILLFSVEFFGSATKEQNDPLFFFSLHSLRRFPTASSLPAFCFICFVRFTVLSPVLCLRTRRTRTFKNRANHQLSPIATSREDVQG